MATALRASPLSIKVARPVLRYYGGKWHFAPWVISKLPRHDIYCEPYGGAASVLMRKPRSHAEVYNDLDGDTVNVFRMIRESGPELQRALSLTPFSREEFQCAYEETDDPLERARRTIVRAFLSHGSTGATGWVTGFRARGFREHVTAAEDWANYPAAVPAMVERLQGVVIDSKPALEVIAYYDSPTTCFYLDPPYPRSTRSTYNRYCKKGYRRHCELTDADHERLAELVHDLEGMVVISSYPSELYDSLYGEWHQDRLTTTRTMNFSHQRTMSRTEVLWSNAAAVANRDQLMLELEELQAKV